MCTKKKLEWIQVPETFTSLRVCACGCICVNIYMYTCGRHTPTVDLFFKKKSICMLTSRADVCVKTDPNSHPQCSFYTCERGFGDSINTYADDVTIWSNLVLAFWLLFSKYDWQHCLGNEKKVGYKDFTKRFSCDSSWRHNAINLSLICIHSPPHPASPTVMSPHHVPIISIQCHCDLLLA